MANRKYKPIPPLTEKDIARFWKKVDKSPGHGPKGECWEWKGARDPNGYGRFHLGARHEAFLASRVGFYLQYGYDPTLHVLHRCDNPPCIRDRDLFEGTQADNVRDCKSKGRTNGKPPKWEDNPLRLHPELRARGDRSGARLHPEKLTRGERHHSSVFTSAVVYAIRADADRSRGYLTRMAKRYGGTPAAIWAVLHCKSWKHLL